MEAQSPGPPPSIQARAQADLDAYLLEDPPVERAPVPRDAEGYATWRELGRRKRPVAPGHEEGDRVLFDWVAVDRSQAWRMEVLTKYDDELGSGPELRSRLVFPGPVGRDRATETVTRDASRMESRVEPRVVVAIEGTDYWYDIDPTFDVGP